MKKIFVSALSFILAAILCGCGSFTLDTAKLNQDVLENVKFETELQAIDNEVTLGIYYSLPENVTATVHRAAGACADQFCIFTAEDAESAAEALTMVNDLLADLKETYAAYDAEEVAKLNQAVVRNKGNYVVLVVTDDYDNAAKIVDSYIG